MSYSFQATLKKADGLLFTAFLLLVFWAPIPLGSNRLWSSMLLVFFLALISAFWLMLFANQKVQIPSYFYRAKWALVSLVLFQLFLFLQTIALPQSLLSLISPNTLAYFQDSEFSQSFHLSINVHQSYQMLILGLGFSLAFILSLLLLNTKERIYWFCMALVFSGLLQALYGILAVFIDGGIFDFYDQLTGRQSNSAKGTFVNSNHFAGYINICLAMTIGLLMSAGNTKKADSFKKRLRKFIKAIFGQQMRLRVFVGIMLVALVMSMSRMGNVAFFIAIGVTACVYILRKGKLDLKTAVFFISFILIDILLVGSWFGLDKVVDRIEGTKITENARTSINATSFAILKDHALVGVGAGSYASIEPKYTTSVSIAPTKYAHNDYFEFLIAGGVINGLIVILFLWSVCSSLKQRLFYDDDQRDRQGLITMMNYGILMLLVYISIHSLVDFNLRIPAFAFTVLCCISIVFYQDEPKSKIIKT